ncbi:hypothetical protein Cgig2_033883 [Carnegiea gigantea]|uniref:Uncharacterized protein n=1 Tax=Carnegiea gigantea TaxID=171969 RepID=A0A9Q1JJY7_9CARY|nr:hypothetical protein Cgig2_033883 [Carnegiea gigantea]
MNEGEDPDRCHHYSDQHHMTLVVGRRLMTLLNPSKIVRLKLNYRYKRKHPSHFHLRFLHLLHLHFHHDYLKATSVPLTHSHCLAFLVVAGQHCSKMERSHQIGDHHPQYRWRHSPHFHQDSTNSSHLLQKLVLANKHLRVHKKKEFLRQGQPHE